MCNCRMPIRKKEGNARENEKIRILESQEQLLRKAATVKLLPIRDILLPRLAGGHKNNNSARIAPPALEFFLPQLHYIAEKRIRESGGRAAVAVQLRCKSQAPNNIPVGKTPPDCAHTKLFRAP